MAVVEASRQRSVFEAWARLRLESGERVLLSLSPNGLVIFKVILRGALPIWRVWSCSSDEIDERFGPDARPDEECIDTLVRAVVDCVSVAEMRFKLNRPPTHVA